MNTNGLGIALLGLFLPRIMMRWLGWEVVGGGLRWDEKHGVWIEHFGRWQRIK